MPIFTISADPNAENKEFLDRMVLRSIDCAKILGVKWLVIHAGTDFASPHLVRSFQGEEH